MMRIQRWNLTILTQAVREIQPNHHQRRHLLRNIKKESGTQDSQNRNTGTQDSQRFCQEISCITENTRFQSKKDTYGTYESYKSSSQKPQPSKMPD
ncbi:hypothetical protein TVAGG3_0926640 [Trichomonas vaginalis G3]|uniref:hypothetical protein n=1 Tax=Trichomonas vaginalis (strain ATCC PRA-98 / G3) TaxID=412133 RepID=UPI0021E53831|nr:hypothetical protein TVAGG3_0926640 [Trichomonas vaginalis G3]KAI5485529.1 hypothetical protein TVAGG3_0926640 [Trichomonas vaginalis G3]